MVFFLVFFYWLTTRGRCDFLLVDAIMKINAHNVTDGPDAALAARRRH